MPTLDFPSIHSADLVTLAGFLTWVPQSLEESQQATHSAIPVYAEELKRYEQRAAKDILEIKSRKDCYLEMLRNVEGQDRKQKENEDFLVRTRNLNRGGGEIRCKDNILRSESAAKTMGIPHDAAYDAPSTETLEMHLAEEELTEREEQAAYEQSVSQLAEKGFYDGQQFETKKHGVVTVLASVRTKLGGLVQIDTGYGSPFWVRANEVLGKDLNMEETNDEAN